MIASRFPLSPSADPSPGWPSSPRPRCWPCAGALGRPAAAHAGTNGQQIQICASVLTTFGKAVIFGSNQNGLSTAGPDVRVLWTEPKFGPRCNPLAGWWWKGTVTIYWYHADGSYYRSSTCTIPPPSSPTGSPASVPTARPDRSTAPTAASSRGSGGPHSARAAVTGAECSARRQGRRRRRSRENQQCAMRRNHWAPMQSSGRIAAVAIVTPLWTGGTLSGPAALSQCAR